MSLYDELVSVFWGQDKRGKLEKSLIKARLEGVSRKVAMEALEKLFKKVSDEGDELDENIIHDYMCIRSGWGPIEYLENDEVWPLNWPDS